MIYPYPACRWFEKFRQTTGIIMFSTLIIRTTSYKFSYISILDNANTCIRLFQKFYHFL